MSKKIKSPVVFVVLFLMISCVSLFHISYASDFRAMAEKDVEFTYQTILDNHPGPKNILDPNFVKKMNSAYQQAVIDCRIITSREKHIAVLKQFAKSFHDLHLSVFTQEDIDAQKDRVVIEKKFHCDEISSDMIWITLPTFAPNSLQATQLEEIIQELPDYRNKPYIVFDLRGNNGGSSVWGTKILESLFTKDFAQQQLEELYKDFYVDWRVSQGNIDYLKDFINKCKTQEQNIPIDTLQLIMKFVDDIEQAQSAKKDFQAEKGFNLKKLDQEYSNIVTAKIIVVVDRLCFSSALMFVDELKAMQSNVLLVGEKTSSNSSYMEVQVATLPSRSLFLQFPMAVARNPIPSCVGGFKPDAYCNEDLNDMKLVQLWVQDLMKNQR